MSDESDVSEEYRVPVQLWMTWWAPLLAAVLSFGYVAFQVWELEELEAGRIDSVLLPGSLKRAYESGGKWEVVAFPILLGLGLVGLGLYRLIKDRRGTS